MEFSKEEVLNLEPGTIISIGDCNNTIYMIIKACTGHTTETRVYKAYNILTNEIWYVQLCFDSQKSVRLNLTISPSFILRNPDRMFLKEIFR